jgi:hypothetical protein
MSRSRLAGPFLGIAALCLFTLWGCASGSRQFPRADYAHGPMPHQARRVQNYPDLTRWSRLSHEAYEPVHSLPRRLSVDQDLIVREFGQPAYQRQFETAEGEKVLEWLNIEQNLCFQFVDGELVFQGPIRDIEQILLSHGRPQIASAHIDESNIERVFFVYTHPFSMDRQYFSFANGQLIYEEHHD